ncbi:MAG: Poly(3-hydroxyalkanoate) depolymerase [Polaromonas sp.]|nr:Poly(3-hydroxyalkanoate) depolymerase [Polaromonas sp.]
MPLVVMLHGCTQHPDDFAAGTAMNELARAQGFFVLYPAQSQKANPQRCWNWFKHTHQARGRGEPALLAGMTRDVMARYAIDADRIYIAGLSAGGAMAAIMGEAYPELYAAVGVHSGLAAGVATDLPSAMAAMSGNQGPMGKGSRLPGQRQARPTSASHMPTIVFHGDADGTVHHSNGEQVIAAAVGESAVMQSSTVTAAQGRRGSEQRTYRNIDGSVLAEHWRVKGAPHAWSGGRSQGSYTDPGGPDASVEMMRFFMAHPRRAT